MSHNKRIEQGFGKAVDMKRRLRTDMTAAEKVLWAALRSRQCRAFKFRRQHAIGPFIVDFYCPERLLVLEVDGDSHAEKDQPLKDRRREQYLCTRGLRIVRYTNEEVLTNLDGVYEHLLTILSTSLPRKKNHPPTKSLDWRRVVE